MKKEKIELMSPAGSYESLMASIQGGADSIYFGIEQLNMRAKSANNFKLNDLPQIVEICRKNNIKSYLTLNTVLYDDDMELMRSIVDSAKQNNVSAIISSDIAAITYAYSIKQPVHLSTQLNISNVEAIKFYSQYADVMVLARELNLKQVKHISETIEKEQIKGTSENLIKVEIFAHGALCMAISGKCYLSLHEHNLSANRGNCLQTCRKAYLVKDKDTGYELEIDNEHIMSPKDLCTIGFLDKIIESGVSVLKIEGRARSPEYVKKVTQCYREAIDSYFSGTYNEEKIKDWEEKLTTVFNRGFWDGYYLGKKLGEWSKKYGSQASKRKVYIGKAINYFSNIGVVEFLIETGELNIGDEVLIIGPTTGVIEYKINELRVELKNVDKTIKGEHFSIPVNDLIRRSDKLYKIVNAED